MPERRIVPSSAIGRSCRGARPAGRLWKLSAAWESPRTSRLFYPPEVVRGLRPELAEALGVEGQADRAQRLADMTPGRLLDGLDRFYIEQKVFNFYGDGLRLYGDDARARLPFLDVGWAEAILALPRRWRLGSRWHRWAIAERFPRLLDYPVESEVDRDHSALHRTPRPLYWLPPLARKFSRRTTGLPRREGYVHYAGYEEWSRGDRLSSRLTARSELLSELIEEPALTALVRRHHEYGDRVMAIAYLTAMADWMANVREIASTSRDVAT